MSVTPCAAKQLGSAYLGNIECGDCFHLREAWSVRALADLGGRAGRTPSPMGLNSFVFAYIFTKKHLRQRSMPPPQRVHAPPTGNPGSTNVEST